MGNVFGVFCVTLQISLHSYFIYKMEARNPSCQSCFYLECIWCYLYMEQQLLQLNYKGPMVSYFECMNVLSSGGTTVLDVVHTLKGRAQQKKWTIEIPGE